MNGGLLLFEQDARFRRVALLCGGRLERLLIEPLADAVRVGAIYRAPVTARASGHHGAFLGLGGKAGFLSEGAPSPGEALLVQVRREAGDGKAARVVTALEYEGALLLFTPYAPGVNVSRKITDEDERARLSALIDPFKGEGGFVIRTAAAGANAQALQREAETLTAAHRAVEEDLRMGLLHEGPDVFSRAVARWPLAGVTAQAGALAHAAAAEALEGYDVPLSKAPAPFDHHDVEAAIEALRAPRVDLPGGGWMMIEPTAALVAVDVNTGAATGGDAAGRINEAAAAEVPRQLALRALGGVVMVDFAAAPKARARERIAAAFKRAATGDESGLRALGWGPAGAYEATRRKPGRSLAEILGDNR